MPLGAFFDTPGDQLSALYGVGAMCTLFVLVRRWGRFWGGALGAEDRQLAWAVAFFFVLPIGVLLHECGHAIATWMVGGEVLDLSWQGYTGFVVRVGDFTPTESWSISLSGNLISVALGLALLAAAALGVRLRPSLGYVFFAAGLLALFNATIVYPLMTLDGSTIYNDSDWKQIYDFSATPLPSALAAAAHLGLLVALWARRRRLEEMAWAIADGSWHEVSRLRAAIAADPQVVRPRLELGMLFLDRYQPRRLEATMHQALCDCEEHARLYAALGVALLAQHRPQDALAPLRRGLELHDVPPELDQSMRGHLAIALTGCGREPEALTVFSQLREPLTSDPNIKRWQERAEQSLPQSEAP